MEAARIDARPPQALIELPASLENINAKLNHLIVRTELAIKTSERAETASLKAAELSEKAKRASHASGSHALAVGQARDGLPWMQRVLAISMGAVVGGVAANLILHAIIAIGVAAGVSSCLPGF